jgi:integrase
LKGHAVIIGTRDRFKDAIALPMISLTVSATEAADVHTFRHSFGTLLKANGEDIKTVQELLRHASSRITLDVYTQAVTSNKRDAQSKVVRMMVPDAGTKKANVGAMDFEKIAVNAR